MKPLLQRCLSWLLPVWTQNQTPDKTHFYRRVFTKSYKKRKNQVKNLWILSTFAMLIFPSLAFISASCLFTTFLSFSILDESQADKQ